MQDRYYHTPNGHVTTYQGENADSAESARRQDLPKTTPAAIIVHNEEPYPDDDLRMSWTDLMKSQADLSWSQYALLLRHARAAKTHAGSPITKSMLKQQLGAGETTVRTAMDALEEKLLVIPVKRGRRTVGYRLPVTAILDPRTPGGRLPTAEDVEIQNAGTANGRPRNRPARRGPAAETATLPLKTGEDRKPGDSPATETATSPPRSPTKTTETAPPARAPAREGKTERTDKEKENSINNQSITPTDHSAETALEERPSACRPLPGFKEKWARISLLADYSRPWSPRMDREITREEFMAPIEEPPDHFAPLYVTFKIWEYWAYHDWWSIAAALNHYRLRYEEFLYNLTQWTGNARFMALAKAEGLPEKVQVTRPPRRENGNGKSQGKGNSPPRDPKRYADDYQTRPRDQAGGAPRRSPPTDSG